MWSKHLAWRDEIGADTILEDFKFEERDAFISLYPQGYCNVDKVVPHLASEPLPGVPPPSRLVQEWPSKFTLPLFLPSRHMQAPAGREAQSVLCW